MKLEHPINIKENNYVLLTFSAAVQGKKKQKPANQNMLFHNSSLQDVEYFVSSGWPWSAVSFEISHTSCYGYSRCQVSKQRDLTQLQPTIC